MIDGQTIQISFSQACGLSGALLYSVGYLLSAYDKLPSQSPVYYSLKLIAAALVLVSLASDFNLASAVIQVFFIAVSLIGIVRHFSPQKRTRAYKVSREAPGGASARSGGFASIDRKMPGALRAPHPFAPPDR